jgi:hypothetical protein
MVHLTQELETYKKLLPTLAGSEGKFVVISEDKSLGVFDSYQDALTAAYEKLGLKPFLVKQISTVEVLSFFTRELCPT